MFDGFAHPSNLLDYKQIAMVYKPVEHMHNLKLISAWHVNWSGHAKLLLAVAKIFFSHDNAFIIEVCIYNK